MILDFVRRSPYAAVCAGIGLALLVPALPGGADPGPCDVGALSPAIGELSPAVGRLSPAIGRLSPAVGRLSPAVGRLSPVVGDLSPVVDCHF